jgi:hypothetical protein
MSSIKNKSNQKETKMKYNPQNQKKPLSLKNQSTKI